MARVIDKAAAIVEGIFHHTVAKVELRAPISKARQTSCPVCNRATGVELLIPAHRWVASKA
jgi:hypothetical protein